MKVMNYTEKNKLMDKLAANGMMLLFVEIFFAIVDEGFRNFAYVIKMPYILKAIGFIYLVIAACLLIYAYKKDNGWKAIYGIEFLVLAFMTLILPYSYTEFTAPFTKVQIIFPVVFGIYYIVKMLFITGKTIKKRK